MKKLFLYSLILYTLFIRCSSGGDDEDPVLDFTISVNNSVPKIGNDITVTVSPTIDVEKVELYFDETLIGTKFSEPITFDISTADIETGEHSISAVVTSINATKEKAIKITASLEVGSPYKGGIVFALNSENKSGLIVLENDLSVNGNNTFAWGCSGHTLEANSLTDGQYNTSKISGSCTIGAARECTKLTVNGYNDWYLPAREEIDLIYAVKEKIPGFTGVYWSSTESIFDSSSRAYYFDASDGSWIEIALKTAKFKVRPIRKF